MKHLLLPVLLLSIGCAAHKQQPVAQQTLAPPVVKTLSVTITGLCPATEDTPECAAKRAQLDRKKQEKTLIELLQEDFPNLVSINRALRDREIAIMHWLEKHPYD